jgi:nitrous oxidase accessory protein NosD
MSYTLRGRVESRLLSAIAPLVVACVLALALHRWWPVEIAALMVGVGVALDVALYHRVFAYQPGWVALPLGALELVLVVSLAGPVGIMAPLGPALALFAATWLLAQVLGHAAFPWLWLSYAEDGGELGRLGAPAAAAAAVILLAASSVAYATRPPTVTLPAGVVKGPLVITREETLVGSPGTVVTGGIVVRASGVVIRNLTVVGGEYGIDVQRSRRVKLEGVRVMGQKLDGIHVRFSQIMIRDCTVALSGPYTQGIDISYSGFQGMGAVEGCDVSGGDEGIVVHASNISVSGNRVHGTGMRAITMSEMSMGEIVKNNVSGSVGVGIYCGDHSMCEVNQNVIVGTRSDHTGNEATAGVGIVVNFYAEAELDRNVLVGNPRPVALFAQSRLSRDDG